MVESAPDPVLGGVLFALFALVPVWVAVGLVLPRLAPLWGRLAAAGAVEVSFPAAARLFGAARSAAAAWARRRVESSEFLFRLVCRLRARRAVYSGVTAYEEWVEEIALVPGAGARRVLFGEIARYRPSGRLVMRARRLGGKRCLKTKRAEVARAKKEKENE